MSQVDVLELVYTMWHNNDDKQWKIPRWTQNL